MHIHYLTLAAARHGIMPSLQQPGDACLHSDAVSPSRPLPLPRPPSPSLATGALVEVVEVDPTVIQAAVGAMGFPSWALLPDEGGASSGGSSRRGSQHEVEGEDAGTGIAASAGAALQGGVAEGVGDVSEASREPHGERERKREREREREGEMEQVWSDVWQRVYVHCADAIEFVEGKAASLRAQRLRSDDGSQHGSDGAAPPGPSGGAATARPAVALRRHESVPGRAVTNTRPSFAFQTEWLHPEDIPRIVKVARCCIDLPFHSSSYLPISIHCLRYSSSCTSTPLLQRPAQVRASSS